jgi:D-alanyl-D-alanine endopeptidase (penicillin-binding protein 7)
MDEMIVITQDDVDTEKGSRSRLRVGTELSRGELLHLALMSSENRAAHALGAARRAACRPSSPR